jgi:Carboxypeptidase regulatory-like domain
MGRATVCAALAAVVIGLAPARAFAQITTATVSGTIKDSQGGTIPGATVTLISETRGTSQAAVQTNISGDYVFPNVIADTYTVQVSMDGFKTLKRGGLAVSPGDRILVPALTIEMGSVSETVVVRAEAPLVQAQSGERSFAIKSDAVQNIAVNGRRTAPARSRRATTT